MIHLRNFRRSSAVLICLSWSLGPSAAQQEAEQSETMMITLHAKPGAEAELERVVQTHWTAARQMQLVRDTPHLTIRGTEDGNKAYFIHVFTWRDSRIPDAAPAEIRKIWADMNRLVEPRGGHPGLELAVVSVAAP